MFHFLGLLYFHGFGVEKNNDISEKYFNIAVERNFGLAYNSVGFSFYEKNEYEKAKEYWDLPKTLRVSRYAQLLIVAFYFVLLIFLLLSILINLFILFFLF